MAAFPNKAIKGTKEVSPGDRQIRLSIYNRKQAEKPHRCWSYEKSPVTEVTGRGNQRIEDSKTASGIGVGRKNDQP